MKKNSGVSDVAKLRNFKFKKEPSFAELWDICVYNLMYDINKYLKELLVIFKGVGISKKSRILDVSAGGGFPSFELLQNGYQVDCMDAMQDEIDVFMSKVEKTNIKVNYKKGFWEELPKLYSDKYDLLMCRGNSFIYADHGWNQEIEIVPEKSLAKFSEILKIFHDSLRGGGGCISISSMMMRFPTRTL